MKKVLFILLAVMFAIGMAAAQTDVLGPHNVAGRGCASCHSPHSGGVGTGGTDYTTGDTYLWGRDFIKTTYAAFGGDSLTITGVYTETDPQFHTAACLACHDGSVTIAGMTGKSQELVNGKQIPTWLVQGDSESLKNDHPVDLAYLPNPGNCASGSTTCSAYNWPSTVDVNGTLTWSTTDAGTVAFTNNNYGRPIRFYGTTANGGQAMVECSTCHNPHAMNLAKAKFLGTSQVKPSAFFIRGWYDNSGSSNSPTQFCRSCHYSKSNEYLGVTNVVTY